MRENNFVLPMSSCRYISCQISCMRSVIFESSVNANSEFYVGGNVGDFCMIPINVLTYGDVQLKFFWHLPGKQNKDRLLAFFITFNTMFYIGSECLTFKKNQIDMLKKDKHHKLSDENFEVRLRVSFEPAGCSELNCLSRFRALIERKGYIVHSKKGNEVISEGCRDCKLYFVLDGAVEGIVEYERNLCCEAYCHPFGLSSSSDPSSAYIPTTSIVGSNAVFGCSQFLNKDTSMKLRVRSSLLRAAVLDTDFEDLEKSEYNSRNGSLLFPNSEKVMQVWRIPEVIVLFTGLGCHLARRLVYVMKEELRLSSQREFDHCESIDDVELLRSNVLKQFGFPVTEKIMFQAQCFCHSEASSNQRIRLIIFRKCIVVDPSVFGPRLSHLAEKIHFTKVTIIRPHFE